MVSAHSLSCPDLNIYPSLEKKQSPLTAEFKMMKKELNTYGGTKTKETTSLGEEEEEEETEWEMRPGGMLVQKRSTKPDAPVRNLRLRIAYGALRYEISVSSTATFGKLLLI